MTAKMKNITIMLMSKKKYIVPCDEQVSAFKKEISNFIMALRKNTVMLGKKETKEKTK